MYFLSNKLEQVHYNAGQVNSQQFLVEEDAIYTWFTLVLRNIGGFFDSATLRSE